MSKDYAGLAKAAHDAVAAIKDPELRRVAFEKILDDLLANKGSHTASVKHDDKKESKSAPRHSKSAKSKRASGPMGYVQDLIAENFFKAPKTISEVKEALGERGHHIALTSLSGPLQRLCQRKELRRQKTKSDGAKKQAFTYSNW